MDLRVKWTMGMLKVEDLANKINKKHQVITVENVSPLLDHDNAVYVFMGAGDIQTYEYSFERLLSNLTKQCSIGFSPMEIPIKIIRQVSLIWLR